MGFVEFMSEIGALLMGRRSYDIVSGFGTDGWMYGDTPVLVTTNRPLVSTRPTVSGVTGDIESLVKRAQDVAGLKDIYLDGGVLIRQAMDADLVDEAIITYIPTVLGAGIPLFAGGNHRRSFELANLDRFRGGAAQMRLVRKN